METRRSCGRAKLGMPIRYLSTAVESAVEYVSLEFRARAGLETNWGEASAQGWHLKPRTQA